jgi:hypothetical protein
MLIGGVIDDEINNHPDSSAPRVVDELNQVAERPITRVDPVVVGNVVAIVAIGRRLKRRQPDRIDAESFEVVESAAQPFESPQPSPSLSKNFSTSRL